MVFHRYNQRRAGIRFLLQGSRRDLMSKCVAWWCPLVDRRPLDFIVVVIVARDCIPFYHHTNQFECVFMSFIRCRQCRQGFVPQIGHLRADSAISSRWAPSIRTPTFPLPCTLHRHRAYLCRGFAISCPIPWCVSVITKNGRGISRSDPHVSFPRMTPSSVFQVRGKVSLMTLYEVS